MSDLSPQVLSKLGNSPWAKKVENHRSKSKSTPMAAEYCAPVWSRSAHPRLIDRLINDALRLVTGCLRPTPTDSLFVLSGITPIKLCQNRASLSLACRVQKPGHLLHDGLTSHPYGEHRQLKSRHYFVPAVLELLRDASELGTSAARWVDHRWSIEWR